MDIPGFAEALAWEQQARELAVLGLADDLRGVAVAPLTLRRLMYLLLARSPFFHDAEPGLGDILLLLWVASPAFTPGDLEAQALFVAEVSTGTALHDLDALLDSIHEYLDAALNDAPVAQAVPVASGREPVTCFAASIIDAIAAEYGWTRDTILDEPLGFIYGQLRRIALRLDPKAVFINRRSKRVKGDYLRLIAAQSAASNESN